MEGFVKLHRKLLESAVFANEKALRVFIWCLLKATHKKQQFLLGRQAVTLLPGQFITGRKKASEELEIPATTLYDVLTTLKEQQMITTESGSKWTVVTVTNWALYQIEDQNSVSTPSAHGHIQECKEYIDPLLLPEPPQRKQSELDREWELYYIKLNAYLDAKKTGTVMAYPEPPEKPSQIVDS